MCSSKDRISIPSVTPLAVPSAMSYAGLQASHTCLDVLSRPRHIASVERCRSGGKEGTLSVLEKEECGS